jgi:DNA-directed RNA polymerase subunit RPC12/RpoP
MQTGYTAAAVSPVLLCPYCGNRAPALLRNKTATAGWIIFVVLLIIFFPLCWIGFFFQEPYYVCAYCGSKISGTR